LISKSGEGGRQMRRMRRRTIWITVRLLKFNYNIPYSQLLEGFLVDNGVVETPHALQVGRLLCGH
jgi:hypothetical protein